MKTARIRATVAHDLLGLRPRRDIVHRAARRRRHEPRQRSALQDHGRTSTTMNSPTWRPTDLLRPRAGQLPLLPTSDWCTSPSKRAAGHADGLGGHPRPRSAAHAPCRDGSTLTYEWSYTDDAGDRSQRAATTSNCSADEACSELLCQLAGRRQTRVGQRHLHRAGGYPVVRYTFSGSIPKRPTTPGSPMPSSADIMTPVVAGTTAQAGPKASRITPRRP